MRVACWRLFQYFKFNHLRRPRTKDIDWTDFGDVKQKVWDKYFGKSIKNGNDIIESTFPYILRHTQLRPRQLIILCNAIAGRVGMAEEWTDFPQKEIVEGIKQVEESLANEVFNAYSCSYPHAAKIADALSGVAPIFKGNELDKRGHQTASQWEDKYSPYGFRQFLAELGIVGRVRHKNETSEGTEIFEVDFEYNQRGRLVLSPKDLCAVHPMFYRKLNVNFNSRKICVYPFPDHEEFRNIGYW